MCSVYAIINGFSEINIISDSNFVIQGFRDYLGSWVRNGFVNSKGKPLAHSDLWRDVVQLSKLIEINVYYVKAHSGVYGNEMADRLAKSFCFC